MAEFKTITITAGHGPGRGEGTPVPNKISNDAMVTVAGGADMLGWLLFAEPFFVSL